jgi:hypothetical protein
MSLMWRWWSKVEIRIYRHVYESLTIDGVLDSRLGLLITLTHDSWLHLIIAPSLISTLYKSLQHTLSLFSLLCFHQSFPVNGFNSGVSSAAPTKSSLRGLPYFSVPSLQWNQFRVRVKVTLRLAVYRQSVPLGSKPLETHDDQFFQLNTYCYSPYVTSSVTRGYICRLQLVLLLASAVILVCESRGTRGHIL